MELLSRSRQIQTSGGVTTAAGTSTSTLRRQSIIYSVESRSYRLRCRFSGQNHLGVAEYQHHMRLSGYLRPKCKKSSGRPQFW